MLYNNVEQELWRIFTFYSLHADTNQPECMRPASFVRFCKDCQILNSKIQPTTVTLEVTRLLRARTGSEYSASTSTLQFSDFVVLLDILAQKVYSKEAPEFAVKRLLLENVLVLANRRIPCDEIYDLQNAEANKVVKDTFGKCLRKIFDYYQDKADKRRNQVITAEKMQQKDLRNSTNHDLTTISIARQQLLQSLQDNAKALKEYISYKEYVQFCYDFNLKSTALLTAIQIGEIFLNIVPFSAELKYEVGMNFDMFCKAIIYMAFVAYREADARVTAANKVRGILLHMWKAVNDNEKTSRLVSNNRANTLSQFAGSLNVFGSGPFSDQFLNIWMKDGFPDYSMYKGDDGEVSGVTMLKNVVGNATTDMESPKKVTQSQAPDSLFDKMDDNVIIESLQRSVTLTPAATATQGRRTNSVYVQHFGTVLAHRSARHFSNPDQSAANNAWKHKGMVQLEGNDLAELFRQRPELSEFIYMEIENAKIDMTEAPTL